MVRVEIKFMLQQAQLLVVVQAVIGQVLLLIQHRVHYQMNSKPQLMVATLKLGLWEEKF